MEEGPQIERCGGEDTLVEEVPQIASGTVFLRDTRHRAIHQRNFRDKQFPRKVCSDQDDVKVEKHIVTFNEEEDDDTLVEEGPQIERGTVFLRDTCHREITEEAVVTSGSCVKCVLTWAMSKWRKTVGLSMKSRIKSLS